MFKYLSDLCVGEKAVVSLLSADNDIRRRLQDIGLIEGAAVECVMVSPLGDPIAFEICGALIAFRKNDIKEIGVI